jgi:hypothetical protein
MNFSKPLRVNSIPGTVADPDRVSGPQVAVGYSERAHVTWTGAGGAAPLLYSRLNDEGTAFEPQRNLLPTVVGVGGGSVAAEGQHVFVFYHVPEPGKKDEEDRRVLMVASADDGKTFQPRPQAISPPGMGVSAGCGLRAYSMDPGRPVVLYRSASAGRRDACLLHEQIQGFRGWDRAVLDSWEAKDSPRTSGGIDYIHGGWAVAWETKGQVYYAHVGYDGKVSAKIAPPGEAVNRKHPVVGYNGREVLLAWLEGPEGGSAAWQVYSRVNEGKDEPERNYPLVTNATGRIDGVPPGGLIAVTSQGDQFLLFH